MSGHPISKVRENCSKFGEKFFEENGKKITLIKFGSDAQKFTFLSDIDFQDNLKTLQGQSGGTACANPLRTLKNTIVDDDIKELLVVFLTDGENGDHSETQIASRELEKVLEKIYSKFNVIGFGNNFNV